MTAQGAARVTAKGNARPMIHVVGVGLSGADSLSAAVLARVEGATLWVGAQRHLDALMPILEAKRAGQGSDAVETWPLGNFTQVFDALRSRLNSSSQTRAVILASGDPLFFGLGRLLLEAFPAEQLVFHPQVSSMQLAFSRLKLPWQDATLLSVHGRDEQQLVKALKRGDRKIAVLTDGVLTPGAIAKMLSALDLPVRYWLWVCENLGNDDERLQKFQADELAQVDFPCSFAALNVVVLHRQAIDSQGIDSQGIDSQGIDSQGSEPVPLSVDVSSLPLIGLPDAVFKGFPDRPTLM
ncbi:MAG: precorrin-6y C5,15-methyltransferase (decarboxylating) subunit CbiE, partial [Cyanobacteria bacterium J06598_3]